MTRPAAPEDTDGLTTARLPIDGIRCLSCVLRLESALEDVPGVLSASVDIAEGAAAVLYRPAAVTRESLVRAIAAAGYRVTPRALEEDGPAG